MRGRFDEIERDIYIVIAISFSDVHAGSLEIALTRAVSRCVSFFYYYCLGITLPYRIFYIV